MIIIGEKINGSIPKTGAAIAEKNGEFIRNLAKKQSFSRANYLDVCASVAPEKELETLKWLVDIVQSESDVPICLDSPNAGIFAEAVTFCKKPGMINSVSMEGDKIEKVFPVSPKPIGTAWPCSATIRGFLIRRSSGSAFLRKSSKKRNSTRSPLNAFL
jgi:5-methyltetrahydrofolate--homocysteine methyltransferase